MPTIIALAAALSLSCAWGQGADAGLVNGKFAGDRDRDGLADAWSYSAGAAADQLAVSFGQQELEPGRFAQRMTCTRYQKGHAMMCQVGTVEVRKGQWYEARLRAKGEKLRTAMVGLHNTDGWKALGLWDAMALLPGWKDYSFRFQATSDCRATTRFQIWFTTTGTLWVSDVSLKTSTPPQPGSLLPDTGHKNLIPNASFDIPGRWGMANHWTYGWEPAPGQGRDDGTCAAIEWARDDPEFGYYFDYFDMVERPLAEPYLQVIGLVPVRPGAQYTLSAWMKAEAGHAGAPAEISLRGPGASGSKAVRLTEDWQRYSLTCAATGNAAIVQVGPAFRDADAEKHSGCTVFVDDVQLEIGPQVSDFEAHPLDLFIAPRTEAASGTGPQKVSCTVHIAAARSGTGVLALQATDFADRQVASLRQEVALAAGGGQVTCEQALPGPGFYRITATLQAGRDTASYTARWALYPPLRPATDTAFGINHAYARNGFLRLAKDIGISWVRDWSLKWEHVETKQGTFTFEKTDFQINRPLGLGMNVLCMFPFPSAEWSSTAPHELRNTGYPGNRIRQAFAPKYPDDLRTYARACVERYKDRVHVWEVFNESIFTDYSLPRKEGYRPEDYSPLLKQVHLGCRAADPDCRVIGGYSAPPQNIDLYAALSGEALEHCDVVSVHDYPGGPPEDMEQSLERLNATLIDRGHRKPLWMTEFAYYADDDADTVGAGWPKPLESEWMQACYNTRACVIMLANGVEKVFFHIWPTHLNRDIGSRIFFEYAGGPRKIAVTQAALSFCLGSAPRFMGKAIMGDQAAFAYSFQAPEALCEPGEGPRCVTVLWAPYQDAKLARLPGAQYLDICGSALTEDEVTVGEAPVYVLTTGRLPAEVHEQLQAQLAAAGVL